MISILSLKGERKYGSSRKLRRKIMKRGKGDFRHWMTALNGAACWALVFALAKWGTDSQIHLCLAQGALVLLGGNIITYAGSKGLEDYFIARLGFGKIRRSRK